MKITSKGIIFKKNELWIVVLTVSCFCVLYFKTNLEIIPILSVVFTFFTILELLYSLNHKIPIKEFTIALLNIQLLLAPVFDYYLFSVSAFSIMVVTKEVYFGYVFPAALLFYIGLYWPFRKSRMFKNHKPLLKRIKKNKLKNIKMGLWMIGIGFIFTLIRTVTPYGGGVAFVVLIFSYFKFVGALIIWFSESKYAKPIVLFVFSAFLLEQIATGFFINIIIWSFFIYSFVAIKMNIKSWQSLMIGMIALFGVLILQTAKKEYRDRTWNSSEDERRSKLVIFYESLSAQIEKTNQDELILLGAALNYRVNQGWILTKVIRHAKFNGNKIKGKYFTSELGGILLPRLLYPNKPVAGDKKKFEEMAGWKLSKTTTMNVGVLGDGYGNFGYWGGLGFCFFFALIFNYGLYKIYDISLKKYPTLILWVPVIFFFAMRAGNDFYIIANWIMKFGIIVFMFYLVTGKAMRFVWRPKKAIKPV